MLRSPETGVGAAPYWYARVLGIYHAEVWTTCTRAPRHSIQHIEFLWVRWFGVEPDYQYGLQHARLPKLGFVESRDDYAFGFVDPSLVIRGCHLIPCFSSGRTYNLLPYRQSYARLLDKREGQPDDDWINFYAGM
jgi:hypothetical protein